MALYPNKEPPKLSLVAQYDDICRHRNSLVSVDESALIEVFRKMENLRVRCMMTERELDNAKGKFGSLQSENRKLNTAIKQIRHSYAKEIQLKDEMKQERNALRLQLESIRKFILEEPHVNENRETREKVLSYIDLNRLETVFEDEASDPSVELDCDRSEDDVVDVRHHQRSKRKSARQSNESGARKSDASSKRMSQNPTIDGLDLAMDNDAGERDASLHDNAAKNRSFSEPIPKITFDDIPKTVPRATIHSDSMADEPHRPFQRGFCPATASTPIMKPVVFHEYVPRTLTPQGLSQMQNATRMDNRQHAFVLKKCFKPEQCGPCGKRIPFFSNCNKCTECNATCHVECKDKVPLPCISIATPGNKHGKKMKVIGDFVPVNSHPKIPALIVHLCNEIERRGLNETGLYRVSSDDREVIQLKERILKSKAGMPQLTEYDVHILCNVMKSFLRSLDEPIIKRILWRDFVTAAEQENADDKMQLILQAVSELPSSNRDTLAFLIVHLQRICRSEATKMTHSNMAKIFATTIVGSSMIDPPIAIIASELKKQINVMEALMDIPEKEWDSLSTASPYQSLLSSDRRSSVGSRLIGGVMHRGTLTPVRQTVLSKDLNLRPLF